VANMSELFVQKPVINNLFLNAFQTGASQCQFENVHAILNA
jgi:hypothetical protein